MKEVEISYKDMVDIANYISEASDISYFRLKHGDSEIEIRKGDVISISPDLPETQSVIRNVEAGRTAVQPRDVKVNDPPSIPSGAQPPSPIEDADTFIVKSPTVGVFYSAPAPDAAPFVEVGRAVSPNTTLCIIEVMKLMNSVESEVSGTIVEILIENNEPVEFGQPLFVIHKGAEPESAA